MDVWHYSLILPLDIVQYNTTLQLADTLYNSSQTGEDMEKVTNLIIEVGYILSVHAGYF